MPQLASPGLTPRKRLPSCGLRKASFGQQWPCSRCKPRCKPLLVRGAKAGMPQASTTSASGPTQTSHPHGGGVSRASRRRCRRRMVDDSKCEGDVSAGDQTNVLSVNASDQNLTVGNSVYFGDLSELGVGRNSDAAMGSASGPQAHAHSQASLPLLDVQSFQEWMDRRQLPPEAQQNLWQRFGYVVQEDPANGNIEITAITSQ